MFYNIPDDSKKLCHMSQHCTSSQTESACIATSKCIKKCMYCNFKMYKIHNIMLFLRDMQLMSRDRIFLSRNKSVDLTGVLSCRATLLECLRHNLLSLRQVSSMCCHKPDLLFFRTIVGTRDLLSKYVIGILIIKHLKSHEYTGCPKKCQTF